MNRPITLSLIVLSAALAVSTCDDNIAKPDGSAQTLLHATFNIDDLEANGFEIWNLPYRFEHGKIILEPDGHNVEVYGCMESQEQWDVDPGYLYRLTIRLQVEECYGGSTFSSRNYCGMKCNGDVPVWIVTENQDYPTKTSFLNDLCGLECDSEEYCPRYETYVFEVTQNDAVGHVLVDGEIVRFPDSGMTCVGTVETIRIAICMAVSGANSYLQIEDILLQKVALGD